MLNSKYNTKVLFTGGMFEGYIVYKKNGTLFKEDAKNDIENYFNTGVMSLLNYLNGTTIKKNNDW